MELKRFLLIGKMIRKGRTDHHFSVPFHVADSWDRHKNMIEASKMAVKLCSDGDDFEGKPLDYINDYEIQAYNYWFIRIGIPKSKIPETDMRVFGMDGGTIEHLVFDKKYPTIEAYIINLDLVQMPEV